MERRQVAKQTADVPSAQAGDESGPVGCVLPSGKLSQGLDPELEGEPDGIEATPNIVSRTVGGLHRVNWDNPFTGREALEEPSRAGGQSVTSTLALSVLKIRSSKRFGKSPRPDEVTNCAVHRADFTNNRS